MLPAAVVSKIVAPPDAVRVIEAARKADVSLITVESCTAGSLAVLLADTPGAGDVFFGGLVTYSKPCKEKMLGLPAELIEKHSAVSEQVARAMAIAGCKACPGRVVSVAVTCVGGPKPDDDGNPVGLTHIATGGSVGSPLHVEEMFHGTSDEIRDRVLKAALGLLVRHLEAIA